MPWRVEARAAGLLAARRAALTRRFGWAGLELRCAADPRRRALTLVGEVVTARTLAGAVAGLGPALPAGWTIDAAAVTIAAPRGWFALRPGVARLWRSPRASGETWLEEHAPEDMALCTELLPGDGPVALLATVGAAALVQGRDGTVGWLARGRIGASAAAPEVASATCSKRHAQAALSRALRGFRGVPYALGGATRARVDCSGLVQRCVRAATGVVLPRHSSDQLALATAPARPLGEPGDLVFLWGAGESACHVGVVLRGEGRGRRTLVHASSRRGRVIEEPLERALTRAAAVRHVELEQVLALRR